MGMVVCVCVFGGCRAGEQWYVICIPCILVTVNAGVRTRTGNAAPAPGPLTMFLFRCLIAPRTRLLLSVSDTLPPGGGGGEGVKGWLGGSKAFFSGFWYAWTPPPLGGGFSWVLGVRALGLRGTEKFDIVFTQRGTCCTIFGSYRRYLNG